MRRILGWTAAALLLTSPVNAHGQAVTIDSLGLARQYTQWLYEGAADSLVAHSSERARESFATPGGFRQYTDQIASLAGEELAVILETWKLRNGDCQYWRVAAFTEFDDFLLVRWILSPDGSIGGLGVGPNEMGPPVESETCPAGA